METIYNIITLGDSAVGKTSLIRRYIYDLFDGDTMSTIGLAFCFKEIVLENNKKVKLKLIDTGGQEKYRAIAKSYFKNTDGVLFVYSIDNQESFDHITEWISIFNDNDSNDSQKEVIPQFLVEAKNDLERVVNQEISEKFAKEKGLGWISTSSKTNEGVEEMFEKIAEQIYEQKKDKKNNEQNRMELKNDNKSKKETCCLFRKDTYADM